MTTHPHDVGRPVRCRYPCDITDRARERAYLCYCLRSSNPSLKRRPRTARAASSQLKFGFFFLLARASIAKSFLTRFCPKTACCRRAKTTSSSSTTSQVAVDLFGIHTIQNTRPHTHTRRLTLHFPRRRARNHLSVSYQPRLLHLADEHVRQFSPPPPPTHTHHHRA